MKQSIQEVSAETLKIEQYLSQKKPGTHLSYNQIAKGANVIMDLRGKAFMRTALKRLRFEYLVVKAVGITLASPDTATTIITHKLVRVDNAVKRGEKSYNNLVPFYNQLSTDDQKKVNFIGAAFGAIRLAAENGKRQLKYEAKKAGFIPVSKATLDLGKNPKK